MRFTAATLATMLAVFVISGSRPTLSGMTAMPPCEIAPLAPAARPKAPTNLRIVPGLEDLWDLFVGGPHAGAGLDYYDAATAAADPHAYYVGLASRTDCLEAASLRHAGQVVSLRSKCDTGTCSFTYDYANDTDPRKQDAMKMTIRELMGAPDEQIRIDFPTGGNNSQSLLLTMDFWKGREFANAHSKLASHKGGPLLLMQTGERATLGFWTGYAEAAQSIHTLPAGGPFVEMPWNWVAGSLPKRPETWRDQDVGYPRLRLPYNVPDRNRRGYNEAVAPVDSSIDPAGVEMGVVAERWHRVWIYLERVPSEDWVGSTGTQMRAYKWSTWFADTVRPPMRVINERIIGISNSVNFMQVRIEYGAGNVNKPTLYAGRGNLIAYFRNFVTLVGISKANALTLLQKPVN